MCQTQMKYAGRYLEYGHYTREYTTVTKVDCQSITCLNSWPTHSAANVGLSVSAAAVDLGVVLVMTTEPANRL